MMVEIVIYLLVYVHSKFQIKKDEVALIYKIFNSLDHQKIDINA